MNTVFRIKPIAWSMLFAGSLSAANALAAAEPEGAGLEEVVVTGQLRDTKQLDLPTSVSVLDDAAISARGARNLEQLLNLAPNVNFAAGASRGRFVQIRGIGERSQFIDPVNPSVGLIIDGIDFTGLGLAASTLDIDQVEILRGPQGTVYGANALAGLINMTSAAPTAEPMAKVSAEVSEYNGRTLSAVSSGALTDQLTYRLAAQNQQGDGYIENTYLGRDDTNNIDESVVRGKLRYQAQEDLQLDFALLYLDADNGYDAFSLQNTRETLSDQPGWDRQETLAASVIGQWSGSDLFTLQTTLSAADSDTEYGYDEDWTYVGFHPWEYSSTDNYLRDKKNLSADLRLLSTDASALFNGRGSWVAGVYVRDESEDLERNQSFTSQFDTQSAAVYGQLRTALSDTFALVTGLRFEQRDADYADSLAVDSSNNENLWGGNISLEYRYAEDILIYGTVSRGYKAGGVNGRIISASATNPAIGSDVFEFDTEQLLNYELGIKGAWLENRLQAQLAAFYQDRSDVQAKQSIFDPNDFSFDDFLTNAAGGKTTGVEAELNYLASDALRLFASAGWLKAEFEGFTSTSHVDARDDYNGIALAPVDLDGRQVAHAPSYQFFTGAEIALLPYLILRLEVEGKDEFYFSNSHNEKSTAYELLNARLTYQGDDWEVALWGRNLTDKDYFTRGFYFSNQFGNNPENFYAPEAFYQFGEPRVAGVTGTYTF
ncbi:Outer membrane receptor proteins, mostly Fe transport [Microbulbifer donghaiensis]|uniref:Outer membrane receptor proteins, mostly Fe transport n=1 Tax=Microbulbifer donghaiensis TaxID=494016 RepID=A0A1M5AAB1_9GAMM|nr:TonB-dependent receptor [Microbulbifer donghaiensis]SHF26976.1 Outer membrane receptor proteins, mostly Fe transport [Microbulbifer donghaiensis]